ncbi:transcriptional regulator GntR [Pseudomonas syringae pv. theae ICMP 3923]|uniref:GntR family transcriptional regulator n=3 Tax=Pseudomonas syringae group TaxID=136849 RepID=A0A261WI43_9PSED|nr:GntR family transcriptional regulator [Pseudomonas syringae]OZI85670.1 GntR family transcriptional regulator [Pseudomonas avellanae]ATV18218.1 GntR family transcriptional regulator [Pseudomonas syringae pv. actinidiae]EPM58494.1 transcriptional regulator GntR [Pseudomonas syringae pv. actinidiae ICMP 19073]EPM59247.1 transcriptional regulator GntR [Pseudomonas syringae pv. actinidiae ICMP 19071]EPM72777.1 transcriptional regulator GntR [Pseudomonas syringae pv. theae ICMP 3923]
MMRACAKKLKERPENICERIYAQLKEDITEFRLVPGERFTEGEVAERFHASRTPVRQALFRLEQEGHVQVYYRSGWQVRPFDPHHYEELYDVRVVLELAALARLGTMDLSLDPLITELSRTWLVPESERLRDIDILAELGERFHCALVEAMGNREMARLHLQITEKTRTIRRLEFSTSRIDATYEEHAGILCALLQQRPEQAQQLLEAHVECNKEEARRATQHILRRARHYAEQNGEPVSLRAQTQ